MATTQELPSWLTISTSVYTDANGAATTATAVLYLPLTYYGPSIPLGPDWTWGGTTSPASTASETTAATTTETMTLTTATPTSTSSPTSATPSSTSATSTSSNASSSSLSSSSLSSSASSSSPSSSASSTPSAATSGGLSTGAIVGLVVAAVAVLMLLILLCACCYVRRRRQRGESGRRWSMLTPAPAKREKSLSPRNTLDGEYYMVGAEDTEGASDTVRTPGEGSPRHSGEEADPFLRPRSGIATDAGSMREFGQPATRTKMTDSSGSSNWQTTYSSSGTPSGYQTGSSGRGSSGQGTNSGSGSGSRRSYGVGVFGQLPSIQTAASSSTEDYGAELREPTLFGGQRREPWRGNILTPEEQRHLDEQTASTPPTPYRQPAIPESDKEDDFSPLMPPPRLVDPEVTRTRSSSPLDKDEPVVVQTAQRVRMSDVGPRVPRSHSPILEVDETEHPSPPSSRRVSGQSWLGSLAGGFGLSRLLKGSSSHKDVEAGQSLLGSSDMAERAVRPRPTHAGASSSARPMSGGSVNTLGSGSTVFFDAPSKPGTPALVPPPRAFTPGQESRSTPIASPAGDKPVYGQPTTAVRRVNSITSEMLDQPAPAPLSTFTSASSMRDTVHTDSTDATKVPSFPPPGLALLPAPMAWTRDGTPEMPSPGYGGYHDLDVLEEEPPIPGAQWRHIAETLPQGRGPRTTFGMPTYIQGPGFNSEQASLYSMRSHIDPSITRSTGSAPASSLNSSHPSRRKGNGSGSTTGSSLAHSASITSDGRRRRGPNGPTSPVLSAFGDHARDATGNSGPSGSGSSHAHGSSSSHTHASSAHAQYDNNYLSPDHAQMSDEVAQGSALFRRGSMPWAGGLPADWNPAYTESDAHGPA